MHLTTQHIEFIDTYLENSGVQYVDIRYEMADHVATALEAQEGDFYEQFRLYMARNKKQLMQNNRNFAKEARKRALKMLLRSVTRPYSLLILVVVFFVIKGGILWLGSGTVRNILSMTYCVVILGVALYYKLSFPKRYSKFSVGR